MFRCPSAWARKGFGRRHTASLALSDVPATLHATGEPRAWPSRGIGVSVSLAPGNFEPLDLNQTIRPPLPVAALSPSRPPFPLTPTNDDSLTLFSLVLCSPLLSSLALDLVLSCLVHACSLLPLSLFCPEPAPCFSPPSPGPFLHLPIPPPCFHWCLLALFFPCPGFDLVLFGSRVLFPPPVLVLPGACSFLLATICGCRCCLNPFSRAFCSDCILDMFCSH